jgi:hypothetical protein
MMATTLLYIGVPFSQEEYAKVKAASDKEELPLNRFVRRGFMLSFAGNKEKQGETKGNKNSSVCDL